MKGIETVIRIVEELSEWQIPGAETVVKAAREELEYFRGLEEKVADE